MSNRSKRVVVTGLGLVTANGNNQHDVWQKVEGGVSGIAPIEQFDAENLPVKIAAEVKGLDLSHFLNPKESRRLSKFCKIALHAAFEAVEQAQFKDPALRTDFATIIGVGLGALDEIEASAVALSRHGAKKISPLFIPYAIPNMAAGLISKQFGLRGPSLCTTTACSSGTHAVGEGFRKIARGEVPGAIVGGAEGAISPLGIVAFANMKALSKGAADPTKTSRPFDLNRDGFVMGDGAGILVMEDLEFAEKRGANILGEIVGYGASGDAYHITAPPADGAGAVASMQHALADAQISPDAVQYVNAHGTSTVLNDRVETLAIKKVFGNHAQNLKVSSTKGVTGHCLGGAGGVEAALTVLSLQKQTIPPTAHLDTPDPECDLDYVPHHPLKDYAFEYALSNSFGFGGTNATLVLKRFS